MDVEIVPENNVIENPEQKDKTTTLTLTRLSVKYKESLEDKVKSSGGRWVNLPAFVKHILTELDSKGIDYFVAIKNIEPSVVIALSSKKLFTVGKEHKKTIDGIKSGKLKVVSVQVKKSKENKK